MVAITGPCGPSRREELSTIGVKTLLAKPFTPAEILAAVQKELASAAHIVP